MPWCLTHRITSVPPSVSVALKIALTNKVLPRKRQGFPPALVALMTINTLEDLQTIFKNEEGKVCSQVCQIHASARLGHTYVELNWNFTEQYLYKSISIHIYDLFLF